MDDLTIDAQDAASEKEQKTLRMWYKQVAYNRLQKGGRIILIGTRWREDDIQGWLLDKEEQERIDNWTIFKFPALAEEDEEHRKQGEALWPEEFDIEALERIQQEDRKAFVGLYQQRPSIETGNIIQRAWFKIEKLDPALLLPPRVMAIDTAFKEGESNDYSAAVIGQRYTKQYLGVLYAEQKKLDFPALIKWICQLIVDWEVDALIVEDAASGQSVIQTLKKILQIPVLPMKIQRGMDKESRLHAIAPFLEGGNVLFDKWVPISTQEELMNNLLAFPNGAHDDLTDAFVHLITYLARAKISMRRFSRNRWQDLVPNIYER